MKSVSAQKKLLTEADLTFAKAIEIAEGMNAAEATQQFNLDSASTVHYVHQPCSHYCGRISHASTECRYKDVTCHFCKKRGHLASICCAKQNKGAVDFSKVPPGGSKTQFRKFFFFKWMAELHLRGGGGHLPPLLFLAPKKLLRVDWILNL